MNNIVLVMGSEYQAHPVIEGLRRCGVLAIPVQSHTPRFWRAIYSRDGADNVLGVLFTGGTDVDPLNYGEAPHPKTGGPDWERDGFETLVFEWATARGIPMFGYCRGHQFLNVKMGAKLVQHIEDHGLQGTHPALVVVTGKRVNINSTHHQAVDRDSLVGNSAVLVEGYDGVVEATAYPANQIFTVQWHPEFSNAPYMGDTYELYQTLFEDFYTEYCQ